MESLFCELKNVLETEKNILEQLLDTARKLNRALRRLDAGVILSLAQKERKLADTLRRHDRTREGICKALAEKANLHGEAAISEFVEKAPPRLKEDLDGLLDSMGRVARELALVNETNGLLARQAMRLNEIFLQVLNPEANRVYTPDGRMREDHQRLVTVNKEV
ncbi:MAG: flagellar protein FlgN [Peptococcaceae bacterium]|nr:flagellar protein FlgN [Peptococcaceae bacterium]